MRFWLSRNSEVPIREQLVTQIVLGILSGDLESGRKLPSTRELARLFRVRATGAKCRKRLWYASRRNMPQQIPKPRRTPSLQQLKSELHALENPARAHFQQGFFKCRPGEYAAGDVMLGIPVPIQRKVAKKYASLSLADVKKLLASREHEFRFVALVILAARYSKADALEKKKIAKFYLSNLRYINNWDLVDTSAPQIIGDYFFNYDKRGGSAVLRSLARSKNLWQRRVAMVATQYFIRMNDHALTMEIAEMLLGDKHDLIHKASGWMLREIGKRDVAALERFLAKHKSKMPRTMLRYAIERFPEKRRREYLRMDVVAGPTLSPQKPKARQ